MAKIQKCDSKLTELVTFPAQENTEELLNIFAHQSHDKNHCFTRRLIYLQKLHWSPESEEAVQKSPDLV